MEAMAAGCPVIYTKRSSGSELIKQGENGSLVDPDDIDDMAGKIIELLKSKELQQRYSQKGRETVSINFNIQKSARDHVKYYQEVINNHHLNSYE
jgi:mannosyltransferase